MKSFFKNLVYKNKILLFLFVKLKYLFYKPVSQSNESIIILELIKKYKINGDFLEIGFSPWEYNCSKIPNKYQGIIIDANKVNIQIGKWLLKNIKFICQFVDLDNIEQIINNTNFKVDILSLDVDGNDFYLMKKLINLKPSLIVCEYNPSFFIRPITIKYRKDFDRTKADPNWLYYGCSLKGWEILMKKYDYSMIKISNSGVNVFFIKNALLKLDDKVLTAEKNFVDYDWPNQEKHDEQWNKIKHMDFENIN